MKRHSDWSTPSFGLSPIAPATGPFGLASFLEVAGGPGGELFDTEDALAALVVDGGVARFAGDADVTDYHTPLGQDVESLFTAIVTEGHVTGFDLDSLPIEAAEPIAKGLEHAGVRVEVEQHAVAAVLDLPASFDDYLMAIGKKQRHEVRRKHRRYEESVGEVLYETHHGSGFALEEFFRLHRLSGGAKGKFMTPEHEVLFRLLAERPGWRVDMLRIPGQDRAAAGLFLYVDSEGMYLYNSAYDPELSEASPGVAIIGAAIERAIHEQLPRFDFLKGDEVYKFRLGAEERPLYRVVGNA